MNDFFQINRSQAESYQRFYFVPIVDKKLYENRIRSFIRFSLEFSYCIEFGNFAFIRQHLDVEARRSCVMMV